MNNNKDANVFGDDFFKSNTIDEEGTMVPLEKAIPTVERKSAKAITEARAPKVPAAVAAFKKKIEDACKSIDDAVNDLCSLSEKTKDSWRQKHCTEMKLNWLKFKDEFGNKVNSAINYPRGDMAVVEESAYDKSRVKI